MQATTFRQLTVPVLGGRSVNSVAAASDKPVRVLIKNPSATTCFFGTASESMIGPGAPGTDVFELGPDDDVIFVLAPLQKLYAVANAVGAIISISVSEAFPQL